MPSVPIDLIDPGLGRSLLEATGAEAFGARLLEAAQSVAFVDEVFAYSKERHGVPGVLASASELSDSRARVASYVERFHVDDPVLGYLDQATPGYGLVQQIRAGDITSRSYRVACFERPGFVDKLCFAWRRTNGWWMVSFYRRADTDPRELTRLGALANLALATLAHGQSVAADHERPIISRLSDRLARSFPQLSSREREVCAATIAGHTAQDIAARLGISTGSVLTYRQRAYRRLDIRQASDLLPHLLD